MITGAAKTAAKARVVVEMRMDKAFGSASNLATYVDQDLNDFALSHDQM